MSFPNPFQIGREVGANIESAFTKVRDENAIESILSSAMSTGNPAVLQHSIGKILSQVSPERQGPAVQYLQNAMINIQNKQEKNRILQEEKNAAREAGYTYGAPAAVQTQQVKDRGKANRLSQYGLGGDVESNGMINPSGPPPNVPNPLPNGQYDRTPSSLPQQFPSIPQPQVVPPLQQQESVFRRLTDDQLIQAQTSPDQEIRNAAAAEQRRREAERKENRADLRGKRKETEKIRGEIASKAAIAQQGIREKERLLTLIKTGNINDPTVATLLENVPMNLGKRFLSPETVEYKAGLINGYRDLRNIFSGTTRVKEIELLEDKVADLYLTDEQKESILRSSMQTLQYDIIKAEVAAQVEKDFPELGVLEFNKKVDELSQPKIDALANRIIDEQKSFIQDAENRKKIPLDYDDPEGRQILEQLMKEAGGDKNKARSLAKKKGYIIGK